MTFIGLSILIKVFLVKLFGRIAGVRVFLVRHFATLRIEGLWNLRFSALDRGFLGLSEAKKQTNGLFLRRQPCPRKP
ncbi:MAG: hypothetical protein EOM23_08820 [Candidatus Moranbacteria bacterium]|nr:hypothetical protein [Candidatus Moranbacteria bacterium]